MKFILLVFLSITSLSASAYDFTEEATNHQDRLADCFYDKYFTKIDLLLSQQIELKKRALAETDLGKRSAIELDALSVQNLLDLVSAKRQVLSHQINMTSNRKMQIMDADVYSKCSNLTK